MTDAAINPAPGIVPAPSMIARWTWPLIIVGLLGLQITLCVIGACLAERHASGGIIVPDYYQKALNWDTHMAAVRASESLGWTHRLQISPLAPGAAADHANRIVTITLTDHNGRPVDDASVQIHAYADAQADRRLQFPLARVAPGRYTAAAPMQREGLWHIDLDVHRGRDRYIDELPIDITAAGADSQ